MTSIDPNLCSICQTEKAEQPSKWCCVTQQKLSEAIENNSDWVVDLTTKKCLCGHPINVHPACTTINDLLVIVNKLESELNKLKSEMKELKETIIRKSRKSGFRDSPYPALPWDTSLDTLKSEGKTFKVEAITGPSVLSLEEVKKLEDLRTRTNNNMSEAEFDYYMFPVLESLLCTQADDNNVRLYNSGKFKWLRKPYHELTGTICQKPDYFIAPIYSTICREDDEHKLTDFKTELKLDYKMRYGIVADYIFYQDIVPMHGKLNVNCDEDLNQMRTYCEYLSVVSRNKSIRGMIFDTTNVHLIECKGNLVMDYKTLRWTDVGSRDYIRKYLLKTRPCSMEHRIICAAKDVQKVEFVEYNPIGKNNQRIGSFLGKGAEGYVFCVKYPNEDGKELFALKVVSNDYVELLKQQQQTLTKLAEKSTECVKCVGNVKEVKLDRIRTSACLLYKPVGTPLLHVLRHESTLSVKKALVIQAGKALLRLHEQNCWHGDARLENCVVFKSKIYWIDFRTTDFQHEDLFSYDISAFKTSIERKFIFDDLKLLKLPGRCVQHII